MCRGEMTDDGGAQQATQAGPSTSRPGGQNEQAVRQQQQQQQEHRSKQQAKRQHPGNPTLEPLQQRFERMSEEDRVRKVSAWAAWFQVAQPATSIVVAEERRVGG